MAEQTEAATEPRYAYIEVCLSERDSNAMVLVGAVSVALRRAGVSTDEVSEFIREATSGDYDHLLQTCIRWVSVS